MNRAARRRAGRDERQSEPQHPPIGAGVVDAHGNIPIDIKATKLESGGYHLKIIRGDGYVVMDGPIVNADLLAQVERLVARGFTPEGAIARQIMDRVATDIPVDGQCRDGDR